MIKCNEIKEKNRRIQCGELYWKFTEHLKKTLSKVHRNHCRHFIQNFKKIELLWPTKSDLDSKYDVSVTKQQQNVQQVLTALTLEWGLNLYAYNLYEEN